MTLTFGCSFAGLDEGLEGEACDGPAFCAPLNEIEPPGDPCLAWTCDRASNRCAVLPMDADNDGAPAPGCAPVGTPADCDDLDPTRSPLLTEICDGVDNDCSGAIDEGTALTPGPVQTLVPLAGSAETVQFEFAASPTSDRVRVGWLERARDTLVGTPRVADLEGVSSEASTAPLLWSAGRMQGDTVIRSRIFGLASLGSRVVAGVGNGCQAVAVGTLNDNQVPPTLDVDDGVFQSGIPLAAGSCDVLGPQPASSLSLDADETYVYAAWRGTHELVGAACGTSPETPVRVAALRDCRTRCVPVGTAVELPTPTTDRFPPAFAATSTGMLIGYGAREGVVLQPLDVTTSALTPGRAVVFDTPAEPSDVQLTADASGTLVIAYRSGCQGVGALVLAALDGGWTKVGELEPAPTIQRRPRSAHASKAGWVLTWAEAETLFAQRFRVDESPAFVGPAVAALPEVRVARRYHLEPLTVDDGFQLVSPTGGGVVGTTLLCRGR
ncbi:MAG: putative metal-binding motif-containing protein [Myxococcota bacterium]